MDKPNSSWISQGAKSLCGGLVGLGFLLLPSLAAASPPFLPPMVSAFVFSTIPSNGDLNPYGVAFVPPGFPGGNLNPGDVLVSNFNNSLNQQGTGTTILRVQLTPQAPNPQTSTFADTSTLMPPVIGLTDALGAISQGFVFVGSVFTNKGDVTSVARGPLVVLDDSGAEADRIPASDLNGPWGLAINSRDPSKVQVFVSNVFDGTISRIDFSFPAPGKIEHSNITQIASGYSHKLDSMAVVIGPAGLVYDQSEDILYVAGEDDDKIFAVSNASTTTDQGTGRVIFADPNRLHGPMGLSFAPNGNLIVANNDSINPDKNQPSELVEFTIRGKFVREISIDPNLDGPFGIAFAQFNGLDELPFVNDNNNTLTVWNFQQRRADDMGNQ